MTFWWGRESRSFLKQWLNYIIQHLVSSYEGSRLTRVLKTEPAYMSCHMHALYAKTWPGFVIIWTRSCRCRGCSAPPSPTNSYWNWRLHPAGSAMNNLWSEKCRGQVDNSKTKVIKWRCQQLHELFIFLGAQISPSAPTAPLVKAHSGRDFIETLIQFFKVVTF